MSIFFETFFTVRKPWFMSSMNILIDVCLPRVQYYYWHGCHCCRVDRLHGSHLTLTSRLTTLSEEGLSPGPSLCYYESRQSQSIINSVRSKSHDIYDIRSHDVGHGDVITARADNWLRWLRVSGLPRSAVLAVSLPAPWARAAHLPSPGQWADLHRWKMCEKINRIKVLTCSVLCILLL